MNETVFVLKEIKKYYRRPGGQCCKSQNADMKCIKSLDTAIKACQILEKLTEEIENCYGRETELTREARGIINGK